MVVGVVLLRMSWTGTSGVAVVGSLLWLMRIRISRLAAVRRQSSTFAGRGWKSGRSLGSNGASVAGEEFGVEECADVGDAAAAEAAVMTAGWLSSQPLDLP